MLVGGNQGVTVKSNNNMIISDENGTIDINEIKLRVPAGTLHKRNQSLAQKPLEDEKDEECSMDEMAEQEDSRPNADEQTKVLKGDLIKNILKSGPIVDPSEL